MARAEDHQFFQLGIREFRPLASKLAPELLREPGVLKLVRRIHCWLSPNSRGASFYSPGFATFTFRPILH
jgi:hypothetical protein